MVFQRIFYFLYIQLVGAIKLFEEQIYPRQRKLQAKDLPSQAGRNIVITGGNRGIGLEAVKKFLSAGAHVIVGCRRPEDFQRAIEKFQDLAKNGTFEAIPLDLMSLRSVRKFGETILEKNIPIHVLINNAGIMFGPRTETEDGFESQLATNYLGHFLLTSLMLPKLRESGTPEKYARIINVSSAAHFLGSWMDFDDLQQTRSYIPEQVYGNSKAAQIMMSTFINGQLKSENNCYVSFNSIHPGVVKTELYTHVGWVKFFDRLSSMMMKTPEQGGDTLVHAAISTEVEGKGGLYFENFYPARNSSFTKNKRNQEKLFELSCKLLDIQHFGKK